MAPNLDKKDAPSNTDLDATGEFSPEDGAHSGPPSGDTEHLTDAGTGIYEPEAPPSFEGTVDFKARTEVLSSGDAASSQPGDVTCDVPLGDAVQSVSLATELRQPAAATMPAAEFSTGSAIPGRAGRYVFKKFHAKGGMGEVWLAEDSDIGRPVALKRILKGRKNQKERFVQEARVTGQLEHPGIIPVHELSLDENDQPYYVMKFVHGQTLKEVIEDYHKGAKNAETPREVQWLRLLNIFLDLCQTIAYAHSRGVIHRDIKPDNVMIGAYGETLVLDWGLAKVVGEPETSDPAATIQLQEGDTAASLAGTIKGSPYFLSPEVAAGKVNEVDQVSDVYLLGGTLYNMITGRPPRGGKKNITALLEDARKTPPVPPRTIDSTIPKPLDAICQRALAHQKEDRYQSASALAEDVQRYLAGEPVSAYPESLIERTWRWVKRHRTALSRTAAALVLLTVAGTAFAFIRDARMREAEAMTVADKLTREETARQEIGQFRQAMEEARYYAASADPVAEHSPSLDAANAEAKAKEALEIAQIWGSNLDKMPLEDQRPALKKDLYELLLEIAQLKSRRLTNDKANEVQTILGRAVGFQPPTPSYHRLRAHALDFLGKKEEAVAAKAKAAESKATTAMDHYLLGEQQRVESLKPAKDDTTGGKLAGIKGLLARREALLKAIEFYRLALRDDPNHFWSHFQLGSCYSGLGAYSEAAEVLGACIASRPQSPWGYSARGLALAQLKNRTADAEADLNRALTLAADFRPARLHRAVFYHNQKRYKEAEGDFDAVLAPPLEKRLPEAAFARGQMYADRKMFDEALADFKTIAAGPRPIHQTHLYMTRIYLVKEDPAKALESLSLFLKRSDDFDPESPRAYEQRGRELRLLASEFPPENKNRREGVYLLASTQLEKAVQLGGETASLYDELGSIEQRLAEVQPKQGRQRLERAIKAYSKGIDLAPKDEKLRIKRGWAYIDLSKNEEAKEDFEVAVEVDPAKAEAYTGLGYTEALLKAPAQARRHACLAILHGSQEYLVLHNVACIFGALSKTDVPRATEYHDMALDQLHRALDLWRKGGKLGPNEITLIEIESAFPDELRARPEFKKLLEKNP